MARRWLLTMLAGTAISLGIAGSASAQELPSGPPTVDADVVAATATLDPTAPSIEVEVTTDVVVEPAAAEVAPVVTAGVEPAGPSLDVEGPVSVGGAEVPVPETVEPVEELLAGPAATEPAPAPAPDHVAAGAPVTPAPAPAPTAAAARPAGEAGTVRHASTLTADRAAHRAGLRAGTTLLAVDDDTLAPEVAPPADVVPLVAAAAPTITADLGLPVIDPTPTVPAVLRILAGLLVLGAAATWRTVRADLA